MMTTNFLIMLASIAGMIMSVHAKVQPVEKPILHRCECNGLHQTVIRP